LPSPSRNCAKTNWAEELRGKRVMKNPEGSKAWAEATESSEKGNRRVTEPRWGKKSRKNDVVIPSKGGPKKKLARLRQKMGDGWRG